MGERVGWRTESRITSATGGGGSEPAGDGDAPTQGRKPTVEEAEAILTLVRGGWLRLELTLDIEDV